jgi:uncharacterized protein YdeI (BOF family)
MRISLLCSVASLFLASTAAFAQGEGEFRPQEDPSPSGGFFISGQSAAHGLMVTHSNQLNNDLPAFVRS